MPIIKSARKRVKVARSANLRNFRTKREMREAIKSFSKAVADGNAKQVSDTLKTAASAVDTAVKKDVIHKNKAARIKARMSAQAKATGAKPTKTAAKIAQKAPTKAKPAAKTVKKPVAKAAPKTAKK